MENKKDNLFVVGIGASAGGLEALLSFVKTLPINSNLTYIVAQHLSPSYKSMMADLLSKEAMINIKEAQNAEEIKPDTMYICPANKNIIIEDNKIIILNPKEQSFGPRPSINILFESIAQNYQQNSIGIILSGTGSDGSRGVRAIKSEGGFTIAQQPQNAKYDGMPISAINTGHIDLILDTQNMVNDIIEITQFPKQYIPNAKIDENTTIYKDILRKLNDTYKVDFTLYKPSTIKRRIERRMIAFKSQDLLSYYEYLSNHQEEQKALFNDILIGVTSFFRDKEAFENLSNQFTNYLKTKKDKNIRIWIPGCSTGEEAYSIAIMISEILKNDIHNYKIQIFATDIDENATSFARLGKYPESSLNNLDNVLIKKYFLVKNDDYELIKPIKDMCLFSKHNIINDPAFMRLDLVSCRNMLIYFTQELQQKVFSLFHYALNDNGMLFLGKSESLGNFNHQFKIVDTKWKIFESIYLGHKYPPTPAKNVTLISNTFRTKENNINFQPSITDLMLSNIQKFIMPTCIVINDSWDIIFVKGKNPYLIRPEGEITQNVFKNVTEELCVELRAALHKCVKISTIVKSHYQKVILNNEVRYVRVVIVPMDNDFTGKLFLVCFQEEFEENLRNYDLINLNSNDEDVQKIKLELDRTKEHLQTVIEELETSNEEMQTLNEDLQSSNEELQSSNEELETTNEELQSTNEELQTAYTEMRAMYEDRDNDAKKMAKIKEELEQINFRYKSVLDVSDIGVFDYDILQDKPLYIDENWSKLFGYSVDDIIKLSQGNIVKWYESKIHPDDLAKREKYFEQILLGKQNGYNLELRIKQIDGCYKWVKCFVVGVKDNTQKVVARIIGILIDIDEDKKEELKNKTLKERFEAAASILKFGTLEYDIKDDSLYITESLYDIFEIERDEKRVTFEIIKRKIEKEYHEGFDDLIHRCLKGECDVELEFNIFTSQGKKKLWTKMTILEDENKNPYKLISVIQVK